jgi:hypothetical protein
VAAVAAVAVAVAHGDRPCGLSSVKGRTGQGFGLSSLLAWADGPPVEGSVS